MAQHLQLTVRFLTDRYHGSEWPPSPARLFQALVAGAKTGAPIRQWDTRHQEALEWLEGLDAPNIYARPHQTGKAYTLFVPNNSLDGSVSTKTSKPVLPRILVDHTLGEPDVVYRWTIPNEHEAQRRVAALDEVASRLRALGWGVDFAAAIAQVGAQPSAANLERLSPDARGGVRLRIPTSGLFAHLDECHQAFKARIGKEGINPYTRPTRFTEARYSSERSAPSRRFIQFELQTFEGRPFAVRWGQVPAVAAWVRHAAGEALKQEELSQVWIDSFVLGHTAPSDLGHRLSFVPLPSIGHQHSDGGVRRLFIVEPPSTSGVDAEALDLLEIKLAGWALTDERGVRRAMLAPVGNTHTVLPFYRRKATIWQTVTPVILHGHNATRGRISLPKTDRLLRQAFRAAGFPDAIIDNVTFQSAPYWPGSEGASSIRLPRHLAQWPRMHVRVQFKEPVQGPVIAGIGRHYGIGVFAAAEAGN